MPIDFQVKICGLTRVQDVRAAAAAGADAIGLNFYAASPRFVEPRHAQHLIAAAPRHVKTVGVFVNADIETICGIHDALGLDYIQLHGDEPPEFLRQLAPRRVIRAFRIDDRGLAPVAKYLAECAKSGASSGLPGATAGLPSSEPPGATAGLSSKPSGATAGLSSSEPRAALLDAHCPGEFGGTGQTANWEQIATQRHLLAQYPLILAGGLTPENVANAIATVSPDAVDVSSGVESKPGHKDPNLLQRFITAAKSAFPDIGAEHRP